MAQAQIYPSIVTSGKNVAPYTARFDNSLYQMLAEIRLHRQEEYGLQLQVQSPEGYNLT
jgi:hypothetical protein